MFNLLTMLDELFTAQWREIAAVFVLSCCVFTQLAIIGKCLTTLIAAVDFFIIILFTITFIITLHYVQFVKYNVTVSFMAQVLDTVTYLVPQVLDTAS